MVGLHVSLTGNFRYRTGLFGKVILQVEEKYNMTTGYEQSIGMSDYYIARWRDAKLVDLHNYLSVHMGTIDCRIENKEEDICPVCKKHPIDGSLGTCVDCSH